MATVLRISLPTYNALTDTDPRHYSLFADQDNVLIKEFARGSGNVAGAPNVTHNLGYIPFYITMGRTAVGCWKVANAYDPLGGEWQNYVDNSKIYFDELSSSEDDYQYYIFYDDFS